MKLLEIKDYLLLIDEEANFTDKDYYYDWNQETIRIGSNNHITGGYKQKIIGYYPLTSDSKELTGIPLLPPYKEGVAEEYYKKHIKNWDDDLIEKYGGEVKEFSKVYEEGYKANVKQFTLEDIEKAIDMAKMYFLNNELHSKEEIIQSISNSQQSIPKEFIPEIEQRCSCICHRKSGIRHIMACCHPGSFRIKHVDGKRILIGEYKY